MRIVLTLSFILSLLFIPPADAQATRLLRHPAISANHIAFMYAGDLWIADVDGSNARRLTTFQGVESDPHFSPDGQMLAFTAEYDGNTDVYVLPIAGGAPQRLTWHPGFDMARGWMPDGKTVIFVSGRTRVPYPMPDQFWTVGLDGGLPTQMVVPRISNGKLSPDGKQMAYQRIYGWEVEWRNYRGGQCQPIRIIDLQSLEESRLPWTDSNDKDPVWLGDEVFFLSDRDLVMNIWSYNVKTKDLQQRTTYKTFDCKNLEGHGDRLIFENEGYLHTLSVKGGPAQRINVEINADFPWAREHWAEVKENIESATISPTGQRAIFAARGDIFTVPAKKGNVRNLSSSKAADRNPAWSPDGQSISWFSDQSGEYQLMIADQYGKIKQTIDIPNPTFFYTPQWSPDSKYLSFGDTDRNLWLVDVSTGSSQIIANEGFAHPQRTIYPAWAPDSRWIAYTGRLSSEYNAVFIYSIDQKKPFQLTDGMSNCLAPAWDKGGEYLYFLSSTNFGLNVGWLDMSSIERPLNHGIYMAVLSKSTPSPLAPESDDEAEEKEEEEKEGEEEEEEMKVTIDFDGIQQRIIAIDVPARNYFALKAGKAGHIYYTEGVDNQPGLSLHKYSLEDREAKKLVSGIVAFDLSHDGNKLMYGMPGGNWAITDAMAEAQPGEGQLATDGLRIKVDPLAEARQIFKEAWRYQRDYFYVENVHGLDLDWAWKTYSPWVEHVRHRSDLNYLLDILSGETAIGHSFVNGGAFPDVDQVPVGLLGADYEVEGKFYKIKKIYNGENWNPNLRSPLSGPGINVAIGDYLLAVNGQPIESNKSIFAYFDQTANQQIRLTVNSRPEMQGARTLTVVPVGSEFGLRQLDWIEGNRRKVDELSNGQLAYVWLPNTGNGGYRNFNRYYFAQKDKKGAIIDERFNQGGYAADYIVDLLSRDLMGYFNNPVGDKQPFTSPHAGIWGPKVMIINEMAGSGGDYLPYMFRKKNIGTLVGTRTWGGLVGIWDVPGLIDGGYITAPRGGFFSTDGKWEVENEGVAPDIEVEQSSKLVSQGRDPQLERAVEEALRKLKSEAVELQGQPADPVRSLRPKQ
ncbi:MAG: PDZ domain-containing protein [Bacteroidota bacterium]